MSVVTKGLRKHAITYVNMLIEMVEDEQVHVGKGKNLEVKAMVKHSMITQLWE